MGRLTNKIIETQQTTLQNHSINSGLYIVTLNNEEPISAQADDPRAAERAIKVNKDNIKVGKAADLSARKNQYYNTFDRDNVNFQTVVKIADIDLAESLASSKLNEYKLQNPSTGRITEWMKWVEPEQLTKIIYEALDKNNIEYLK